MTEEPVKLLEGLSAAELCELERKEWQECRAIIGRLDSTLVDLRKTVFSLASGLLTTGGVLGGIAGATPNFSISPSVIAVLVSVTMLLITVLFVVDRYYSVQQWSAMGRALWLEQKLGFEVTNKMLGSAEKQPWADWIVLLQYGSFILVAVVLGAVVMGIPSLLSPAATLIWIVCIVSAVSIGVLYSRVQRIWSYLINNMNAEKQKAQTIQDI